MKITFFSNYFNHHQKPLSDEFLKLGIDYTFVATEPISEERLKLGYQNMDKEYPFVLTTYDSEENKEKAMQLALDSDIVIIGSAPHEYISKRLEMNKITFRYSERLLKQGNWRILDPFLFKKMLKENYKYKDKNLFLLVASAYAPIDYKKYHTFKNKMYKWGYFPEFKEYDLEKLLLKKSQNKKIKIVWCGRLIKYKNPEIVIKLAKKLVKNNYDFEINVIGEGKLRKKLERKVAENNLTNVVKIMGSVPSSEVRKYMEEANIYLFTSNYEEGWGAVLNESMNSACTVVASHAIGSVPFLINNYKNGIIYKYGDVLSLYESVTYLINNRKVMKELGYNAYNTIKNYWNPAYAVSSLLELYNKLQKDEKVINDENKPATKALPIKQNKMYNYIMKKR